MEFQRIAGQGDAAQRWIDSNLPRCPLCKLHSAWGTAKAVEQLALARWYFECSSCKAVFSIVPETTVSALAPPVTIAKTPLARDLRIESVARSGDDDFVGEEFPLHELQEWADGK